jgi:hypothetical protein
MDKIQERRILEQKLKTVRKTPEERAEFAREAGNRYITKVIPNKKNNKPKHKGKEDDFEI